MSDPALPPSAATVVTGKLHGIRRGHTKRFADALPVPPEPVRQPARVAIMLALAHKIQNAIDRGAVQNRAEVARKLGLTRARVTQLLDMTLLAPDLQEQMLLAEAVDGVEPICEGALRPAATAGLWSEQRTRLGGDRVPDGVRMPGRSGR